MQSSWKLGRWAGIDVYLHSTFMLILAYAGMVLGGFPAILLVVAAFSCVLLHEFGHALMARRFGIETEDITLYPIGGVARLRRMPKSPGAEMAIALAGPAVNVVIAAILALVLGLGLFDGPGTPVILGAFAMNLLSINIVLVLFNMIPAFPMDGGRVLRAALSGWLGRVRATMIAASIGRGLATLFGLYSLVHGDWFQVILAMFIYVVAGAELRQVLAEGRSDSDSDSHNGSDDVWVAPPGFRWVSRGKGVWQLAPIVVHTSNRPSPWR
ncbi:site-2 protease family protein [Singulisphaera acidiphila]|uniref:Zn-dependent protease n=1 Tax=Singulisphaera acidiphila (strain ATCC BAA-1392 / DSM 18658 / VKM B-2454 / MOB10) TaxID=886293 RepID=L0DBN0_SINAD|nr:site-2 protease family protein [Singulisphaera acidiphila]AGA26260.1 Zn-dependent protease [Singulisphaera acidiphila DSM 18658]